MDEGQIDAKRFFDYVVEEVRKRDFRDLSFDYSEAHLVNKFGGMFKGSDSEAIPTLVIRDHIHEMEVMIINYASMYEVASRGYWQDAYAEGMARIESGKEDLYEALPQEARLKLFLASVRQAISKAKDRYMHDLSNA